jgi:hypothetical protein
MLLEMPFATPWHDGCFPEFHQPDPGTRRQVFGDGDTSMALQVKRIVKIATWFAASSRYPLVRPWHPEKSSRPEFVAEGRTQG